MIYYQSVDAIVYAYAYAIAAAIMIAAAAVAGLLIELYEWISGRDIFGGDGDED